MDRGVDSMSRLVCGAEREGVVCTMDPDHEPPHFGGGVLPPDVARLADQMLSHLEREASAYARARKRLVGSTVLLLAVTAFNVIAAFTLR